MSLSPEQFAAKTPMFHGHRGPYIGKELQSARAQGRLPTFDASDSSKVYATPQYDLAWSYAEHGSAAHKLKQDSMVRSRGGTPREIWTNNPVERAPKPNHPHVAHVALEGDIDIDPNWEKPNLPVEEQKAFRGNVGRIRDVEMFPRGAQLSMAPDPKHGGYYSRENPAPQWSEPEVEKPRPVPGAQMRLL